jgi:hypothetical protein
VKGFCGERSKVKGEGLKGFTFLGKKLMGEK